MIRYCSPENLIRIIAAVGDNNVINEINSYTILISTIAYNALRA